MQRPSINNHRTKSVKAALPTSEQLVTCSLAFTQRCKGKSDVRKERKRRERWRKRVRIVGRIKTENCVFWFLLQKLSHIFIPTSIHICHFSSHSPIIFLSFSLIQKIEKILNKTTKELKPLHLYCS